MIPRAAAFLLLWLVVGGGGGPGDIALGAATALAAASASLRLLPRGRVRVRPLALLLLLLRFPVEALRAGIDVARRAFHPALPIAPGEVAFAPRLPPGGARDAFLTWSAMLPGTLPAAPGEVHALQAGPAAAAGLAAEEARFARAFRRDV